MLIKSKNKHANKCVIQGVLSYAQTVLNQYWEKRFKSQPNVFQQKNNLILVQNV